MSLKDTARETLEILQAGKYINSLGTLVNFAIEQKAAEVNTKLYTPEQLSNLSKSPLENSNALNIEVTNETTQVAAHRLVTNEGCSDLVLLNFASAKNPGGGFLNGAKAQEEDLARCSGLYPCLLTQPDYYQINRAHQSLLYTDHLIYSPQVPWFKTRGSGQLLEDFFLASIITAPAPNAGQVLHRDPTATKQIEVALHRRAKYILAVARDNGHRSLLLGAWGCGVFRNNPYSVANAFGAWLHASEFDGCFDRVVFAIYDPSKEKETLNVFQNRFEYHRYLFADLKEELKINNPLLPPWLRYPEIKRYSIGWRMGGGEDYQSIWWIWYRSQTKADLIEYFKNLAPIPIEWADWVAYRLFKDDFASSSDEECQKYFRKEKLHLRKLEEIGLVNFHEWNEWYVRQWQSPEKS